MKGDVSVEVKGVANNCQLGSLLSGADNRKWALIQVMYHVGVNMSRDLLVGVLVVENHLVELMPGLDAFLTLGLTLGDSEGEDLVLFAEGNVVDVFEGFKDLGWRDGVCYVAIFTS